eukprot:11221599-Lingulodinium_polyedra.AAC.1
MPRHCPRWDAPPPLQPPQPAPGFVFTRFGSVQIYTRAMQNCVYVGFITARRGAQRTLAMQF